MQKMITLDQARRDMSQRIVIALNSLFRRDPAAIETLATDFIECDYALFEYKKKYLCPPGIEPEDLEPQCISGLDLINGCLVGAGMPRVTYAVTIDPETDVEILTGFKLLDERHTQLPPQAVDKALEIPRPSVLSSGGYDKNTAAPIQHKEEPITLIRDEFDYMLD